jgi:transcriptional regulator with PAS, ATPase and Fis domain
VPGVVVVFANEVPRLEVRPARGGLVIGRGDTCDLVLDDRRASRQHARVAFAEGGWRVEDLGSHNGTSLDGTLISGSARAGTDAVLAIAGTVLLLLGDVRALIGGTVELIDGIVVGPRMRATWDSIARIAARSRVLHVTGETGSGKEIAARRFHSASARRDRPFVTVNCAAVPPALAESLFFGARRGAYSGADSDHDGYLPSAEGGTLFLDEIGELPLEIQAKLLRALETGEVMSLGAVRPRTVELALCSATHLDLRARVAANAFREDLYFRVAQPTIAVPPLRERREEIAWLVDATLRRDGRARASASFVEAALLRTWPGNVRELVRAVETAVHSLHDDDDRITNEHLDGNAGRALADAAPTPARTSTPAEADAATILDALKQARGNITRAAQALGLHRTQLRRWLERNHVDAGDFKRRLGVMDGGTRE